MEKLIRDFLNIDLHKEIIKLMDNAEDVEFEETQKTWKLGNAEVTIGHSPEGAAFVHYKVDRNKGIVTEFKKFLETIEDDIFVAACDNFETKFGEGSLQKLDTLMEEPNSTIIAYIQEFKESIKDVVNSRIEAMRAKYLV